MIHGYAWSHFTAADFTILIINSLVYLIIGVLIYLKCEKVAMTKGLIGNY